MQAARLQDRRLHVANLYTLDGTLRHSLDHGSMLGRMGICRVLRCQKSGDADEFFFVSLCFAWAFLAFLRCRQSGVCFWMPLLLVRGILVGRCGVGPNIPRSERVECSDLWRRQSREGWQKTLCSDMLELGHSEACAERVLAGVGSFRSALTYDSSRQGRCSTVFKGPKTPE